MKPFLLVFGKNLRHRRLFPDYSNRGLEFGLLNNPALFFNLFQMGVNAPSNCLIDCTSLGLEHFWNLYWPVILYFLYLFWFPHLIFWKHWCNGLVLVHLIEEGALLFSIFHRELRKMADLHEYSSCFSCTFQGLVLDPCWIQDQIFDLNQMRILFPKLTLFLCYANQVPASLLYPFHRHLNPTFNFFQFYHQLIEVLSH